jgi:penicillin-binding protein 1A
MPPMKKKSGRSGAGMKLRPEAGPPRSRNTRIAIMVLKWGAIATLLVGALGAAALAGMFWIYGSDPRLPKIGQLSDYHPKQVTRIYSADGQLIGEIYEERRTFVPIERVAPAMVNAMVDAEDASFFEHGGLDFSGMLRALWVNVRHGETRQGASTITQQVVKTLLLTPERTMRRKVQEIILARRLEKALSKNEILTLYLNQIYFGHGRYGIEEAARFYFGKSAAELNVGEAAMLAGLPQSPERLSPLKHPDAAKARQTYVIEQMARHGHLSAAEAKQWIDAPIRVVKDPDPALGAAPEVVDMVTKELTERYGADKLMRLGLNVRTTIDFELQASARTALENGLEAVDTRHKYTGPSAHLDGAAREKRLAQLKKELPDAGPKGNDSYDAIVVSVSDEHGELLVDLGGWRGAVVLAPDDRRYNKDKKAPSARFSAGDVVRVRLAPDRGPAQTPETKGALALALGPQGAIVVIDPRNRHVLAMVGGHSYQPGDFNRAARAKRQPGSAFKAFVYAAAIDSGKFTPASVVNDAPEVYDLWKPKNYEAGSFKGPVRLRTALALSINTVAIRVMHDVGPPAVIGLAHAMGIRDELPAELSLALGSGVVTVEDMTNAFATFAAGGVFAPPVLITQIGDEAIAPPPTAQALRPETAYVMTSMLESVVNEGTGVAAKKLKRRIAGKTGTSNEGRDAWFVGFTPDLVAGVWIGFDDMRKLGRNETGAHAALPVWMDFMKVAIKTRGAKTFKQPAGVVVARIDRRTGKLASPGEVEGETMDEVFLQGTAPTEVAPAAGEADPNTFVIDQMDEDDPEPQDLEPPGGADDGDRAATDGR